MARRKLPYLGTRGGIFWIRITVPGDLRHRLRRREWKFSLRTREPHLAKLKCLQAAFVIERLQSVVREMRTLTDEQIAETAKSYLQWALAHAVDGAKLMANGPLDLLTGDADAAPPQSIQQLADGSPEHERNAVKANLDRIRADVVARRFDWAARPLAAEFARSHGIDIESIDEGSADALLHAVQRARIEEYRIRLAQLEGNYADAVVRDPLFQSLSLPLRADWLAKRQVRDVVPTLAEAITRYKQSRNNAGAWVGKTLKDTERVFRWFTELNDPSAPLTSIGTAAIRAYIDALDNLPANVIKLPEFKGKELPGILEIARGRKGDVRLSQTTKAKYFSKLKAFFTWCEEQGYAKSPVGKITVEEPRNAKDQRHPFSLENLRKLFSSPQYTGHATPERRTKPGKFITRDGKFWIPLIGLFSGMRLGEIVQLMVADVRMIDSVWCFDVSLVEEDRDGPGKRVKTSSSLRTVPVHPTLIETGLVEYVEKMQRMKSRRLFPDIAAGKDGYYSHNFSKYFSRHLKHLGIKTKKTSFHSLRHNFADGCDRANVPFLIRQALMGHADDSTAGRYGSTHHPADLLFENVARIKFDVDLTHLLPRTQTTAHQ